MIDYENIGFATVGEFKSFLCEHKKDLILEFKKEFVMQDEDYYMRIIGEIALAGSLLVTSLIAYVIADACNSKMKWLIEGFLTYGVSLMCAGAAIAYVLFHLVYLVKAGMQYHDLIRYIEQLVQDEEIINILENEYVMESSEGIKRVLKRNEK
ncbi:MAG: hypothetical protein IJO63_03170 [Bacilli bacterium]|nr:hypothetical protein [Bacilli bacterium]